MLLLHIGSIFYQNRWDWILLVLCWCILFRVCHCLRIVTHLHALQAQPPLLAALPHHQQAGLRHSKPAPGMPPLCMTLSTHTGFEDFLENKILFLTHIEKCQLHYAKLVIYMGARHSSVCRKSSFEIFVKIIFLLEDFFFFFFFVVKLLCEIGFLLSAFPIGYFLHGPTWMLVTLHLVTWLFQLSVLSLSFRSHKTEASRQPPNGPGWLW